MQDENTEVYREVLATLSQDEELITTLTTLGDGLLLASKR